MGNVSNKSCRENQNTDFMFNNFFPKIAPFMGIPKNVVETEGATNDVTTWRIRVACWISKATCTYAHERAHAPGNPHARTHAIDT